MKYVIGVLVILALLFLLWWLFSRNKQRQLDEKRAEAATIRAEAEQRGSVLRGQENFAQQADERAATARQEAEERARQAEMSAREAQRVEDEARQHRDELERARRAHDAELRRADELDPDVEVDKDDPRPLPEDLDDDVRPLDGTRTHTPVPAALSDNASSADTAPGTHTDPELAHDADRDATRGDDRGTWGTGAAAAGAGAAAVGSAYAATRGNVTDDEAATRLASGADFSDNTTHDVEDVEHSASRGESGSSTEWDADMDESTTEPARGSSAYEGTRDDMTQDDMTQDDVTSEDDASANEESVSTDERGTHGGTSDGGAAIITNVEDYASTEPLPAESARPDESDSLDRSGDQARGATDEGSRDDLGREGATSDDDGFVNDERATAGATTDDQRTDARRADADPSGTQGGASEGDAVMITDVEDYASTEPLPAEGSSIDGDGDGDGDDNGRDEPDRRTATDEGSRDDMAHEGAQAESTSGAHESTAADADRSVDDLPDGDTDTDTTSDTRADTDGDRGDATHWPDGTDRINPVDGDSGDSGDSSSSDPDTQGDNSSEGGWSRRISGVEEIRDGGYGVGSAAPLEDRAQPADHPVQAYRDTNTFRLPGADGYDSAEPDVWFYDEESARRAGFNPSEG